MNRMGNHELTADEKPGLKKWQLGVVIAVIALVAAILVAYGAAGSYFSLWHLAAKHKVPLSQLTPIGLDGGLIGVIVLDIALTWAGYPLPFLRFVARFLAFGTVAANLAAGWPDPIAVGLRIFAPVLIVTISESVRAVLLRRSHTAQDPIPLARWLLAFPSTCRMKRRMVLWQINDYGDAVDMELSRLQAIEKLAAFYPGNDWRKEAPGDLVWMLRKGVRMKEALVQVAELTAPPEPVLPARKPAPGTGRKRNRKPRAATARGPQPVPPGSPGPADEPAADLDTEAQILNFIAQGLSASEAGRRAGKTDSYGRQIARKLAKAAPQGSDAVEGSAS